MIDYYNYKRKQHWTCFLIQLENAWEYFKKLIKKVSLIGQVKQKIGQFNISVLYMENTNLEMILDNILPKA